MGIAFLILAYIWELRRIVVYNGIVQTILQKRGGITGNEFESLVIAEIYKQTKTIQKTVGFYHLHTHDGKEVDLLIELQNGYIAIEVKMKNVIDKQDIKHLINLGEMLDKPLLHAIVLSNDTQTKHVGDCIIALNAAYFLG